VLSSAIGPPGIALRRPDGITAALYGELLAVEDQIRAVVARVVRSRDEWVAAHEVAPRVARIELAPGEGLAGVEIEDRETQEPDETC